MHRPARARTSASRLAPTLLVLALAGGACAEDTPQSEVTVGGFSLAPLARFTLQDDRIELHPKALAGVGYNSNVSGAVGEEASDSYYRLVGGLETRWYATPAQRLVADLEVEHLDYLEEDEYDLLGGRSNLEYVIEGRDLMITVQGGWDRLNEPLVQTGEQVEYDDIDLEGEVQYRTLFSRYALTVGAQRTDYLESSAFFDADQRDYDRYHIDMLYGRAIGADSEVFAHVDVSQVTYDSNEQYRDSTGVAVAGGWQGRIGVRSKLSAEAGVEYRSYGESSAATAAGESDSEFTPVVSVGLSWPWEAGSNLSLRAFSQVVEAINSNGAWIYGVSADGQLRLRHNAYAFAGLSASQFDEFAEAGEQRTTVVGSGGVAYEMRDGVGVRVLASATSSDSDVGIDYDRLLAAAEIGIAF